MPTEQHPLTVLLPVVPGKVDALREYLEPIGKDVQRNPTLRFSTTPSTHFARFVILPPEPEDAPDTPTRLLFSSNFDGDPADYPVELAEAIGAPLDEIFGHCDGYQTGHARDPRKLDMFLGEHTQPTQAFYVACRGASVAEIQAASRRREALDEALDDPTSAGYAELKPHLTGEPATPLPVLHRPVPNRQQELLDNVGDWLVGLHPGAHEFTRRKHADAATLQIEDQIAQNQMTIRSPQRPGFLRWLMVSGVLAFTNQQAAYAHGSLSGLTTIHFARWVLVDGGRSILFESNYDGSWENYINDFVEFASRGMDAIWAGAVEFPRGGSRDIEAFKAIIRRYQFPAQVFYSAYPYSTVRNNLYNLGLMDALNQSAPNETVREFAQGVYRRNA